MQRREPTRAAILTGELVRQYPKITVYRVAVMVDEMQRLATKLQNVAVRYCNGYHSQTQQDADEKAQERYREKFNTLLALEFPGTTATFGGDPRGCVVKIQIPGTEGDSWGRDGWGVYK